MWGSYPGGQEGRSHEWHWREQGLGSEEAELLFLLLLLPLGHAVEFLLGLPKDILEVRVGEIELWGWGRGVQAKVSTEPGILPQPEASSQGSRLSSPTSMPIVPSGTHLCWAPCPLLTISVSPRAVR